MGHSHGRGDPRHRDIHQHKDALPASEEVRHGDVLDHRSHDKVHREKEAREDEREDRFAVRGVLRRHLGNGRHGKHGRRCHRPDLRWTGRHLLDVGVRLFRARDQLFRERSRIILQKERQER